MLNTVNSEIFARVLFSQITFKDMFAVLPTPVNGRVISPFRENITLVFFLDLDQVNIQMVHYWQDRAA